MKLPAGKRGTVRVNDGWTTGPPYLLSCPKNEGYRLLADFFANLQQMFCEISQKIQILSRSICNITLINISELFEKFL